MAPNRCEKSGLPVHRNKQTIRCIGPDTAESPVGRVIIAFSILRRRPPYSGPDLERRGLGADIYTDYTNTIRRINPRHKNVARHMAVRLHGLARTLIVVMWRIGVSHRERIAIPTLPLVLNNVRNPTTPVNFTLCHFLGGFPMSLFTDRASRIGG